MLWNKSLKQFTTLSVALCLGMVMSPGLNLQAKAQTEPDSLTATSASSWLVSQSFNPPDRGAPERTAEGGTRGCGTYQPGQKPLTALTPGDAMPLTLAEHPTLYWYVPTSGPQTLEFELVEGENEENVVYQAKIQIPQGGIISHSLPVNDTTTLDPGKSYHWYLKMVCDASDRTGDIVVDGWIERVEPDESIAQELLNATTPSNRVSIYAREGIWHDALSILAQMRRDYPGDSVLFARWQQFLDSVQLGDFATEPLVDATQISQE
jgi:hypothetical protein